MAIDNVTGGTPPSYDQTPSTKPHGKHGKEPGYFGLDLSGVKGTHEEKKKYAKGFVDGEGMKMAQKMDKDEKKRIERAKKAERHQ